MLLLQREIQIQLLDASNEAKFDKLVKKERIKSPFKVVDVGDPVVFHDPSVLSYKLAGSPLQQSLEEGELEASMCNALSEKRKNVDPRQPALKKFRSQSSSSSSSGTSSALPPRIETDQEVLLRRQKQIDFGKNTIGYDNYIRDVPKAMRKPDQPRTPPLHIRYSRRAWEGIVKKWRIQLHDWDDKTAPLNSTIEEGEIRD